MPKVVNHEQRRRELAAAVWQVIRERGVEGASVRAVAQRAGWSPSSLQYYFSTHDELLGFAMRAVEESARERLEGVELPEAPPDRVLAVLEALLPLDADARTAGELWVALLARSLINDTARAANASGNAQLTDVITELLRPVLENGSSPAAAQDLELEVDRLRALFDGITLRMVTEPDRMPPDRAGRLLRHHLSTLSSAADSHDG